MLRSVHPIVLKNAEVFIYIIYLKTIKIVILKCEFAKRMVSLKFKQISEM